MLVMTGGNSLGLHYIIIGGVESIPSDRWWDAGKLVHEVIDNPDEEIFTPAHRKSLIDENKHDAAFAPGFVNSVLDVILSTKCEDIVTGSRTDKSIPAFFVEQSKAIAELVLKQENIIVNDAMLAGISALVEAAALEWRDSTSYSTS
jgi:hypothetical protein